MNRIKFGTDGWRGFIADDFTFAGVRLAAQAIADYLKESGMSAQGVVIGYDSRFLSEQFADAAAGVMAGNGINSWLTAQATPVPVTAFGVKALGAAGAVMITAGHNSPQYSGIKFISEYAGPASLEITESIERITAKLQMAEIVFLPPAVGRERGLISGIDVKPLYLNHLQRLLNFRAFYRNSLKVVVDPMWGAGRGYLEEIVKETKVEVDVIHGHRDVLFGGRGPEPAAAGLISLREAVLEKGADVGLALSGDGGRFGVIDSDGEYIAANEMLPLILYYLMEDRNWRGTITRSVATTHLLDRIADEYGLPVIETAVGFRHIARSLIDHSSVLGGEESGGMSVEGHIPEKDGILAVALIVEMMAARGKSLRRLKKELAEKFGCLLSARLDLECEARQKEKLIALLQKWAPLKIGGKVVAERRTVDGVKIILEDGSWVLARPSGTEQLFRIYAEAGSREELDRLQNSARRVLGL